jgi:hypothetical protein
MSPPATVLRANVPDVGPAPAVARSPVPLEAAEAHAAGIERELAQGTSPQRLRVAPPAPAPTPRGGIPANAEMLETLPKPTVEELAINELTRAAGDEMKRLVEAEGKAVERTGEALPQPAEQGPVSAGSLPAPETVPLQPSGLRMAVESAVAEAKGGLPTAEPTLDLLPAARVEELAINELLRQGIERGNATQFVESLGDAIRRQTDYPKAVAEKIVQQIADGVKAMVHPDKPMTANQVKITFDSLVKAITENRLSEERPGVIGGSALEKWADATIKEGRGRLNVGLDPVQLAAYVVKGAALLERGITSLAEWTAAMVREYGPGIRPYLKSIRAQSESARTAIFKAGQTAAQQEKAPTAAPSAEVAKPAPAAPAEAPLKLADTPATGARDIAPPSAGPPRTTWNGLQSLRARAQFTFKGAATKRDVAGWADAIENKAKLYARQQGNEVRDQLAASLGTPVAKLTPTEETALTFVIEAGGDAAKLAADLDALRAVKTDAPNYRDVQQAIAAVEEAVTRLDRYTPVAERFNAITDAELAQENASGISTLKRSRYVPHLQDVSDDFATLFESGGGSGGAGGFKHVRTHPDFVSSLVAGIKPKTLNAIDALSMRLEAGQRQINTRTWIAQLRDVVDPSSQRPLATDMQRVSRGPGLPDDVVAPQGYTPMFLGRQQVAVLSGYSKFMRVLTGDSLVGDRPLGAALLKGITTFKHLALAFDLFHLANITRLGASFDPVKLGVVRGYGRGLWLTDYAPETLTAMMKRGEIPAEVLPQLLEDKRIIEQGVKAGLNVGQLQQALYTDWVRKVPGLGDFNRFLFERYQRGIMSKAYVIEFQRAKATRPELSDTTIAKNVARDLNVRFANLNRQSWIKSKTFQDLMRVVFLAPQWNEGLLRSELGGVRQGGVALREAGLRQRIVVGSLARSAGTLFLAQLVGNQILNYITSGRPTWHNPEGNKLDAYVPDVMGQSNGFYISPYAMDAELTHQFASLAEKRKGNVAASLRDLLAYKLSGFGRAAKTFATQEDWRGKPLTGWQTAKQVGLDLAPAPIGVPAIGRSLYRAATGKPIKEDYPGATQKSLLQTGGFKAERARTAP